MNEIKNIDNIYLEVSQNSIFNLDTDRLLLGSS